MNVNNPLMALALIVGAIMIGIMVLFLGLCVASLFLPAILVLVGLVMLWRGSKGNQILMVVGMVLVVIGVVLWLWS